MARIRIDLETVEIADDNLGANELAELAKQVWNETHREPRLGAASSVGYERREAFGFRRSPWRREFSRPFAEEVAKEE